MQCQLPPGSYPPNPLSTGLYVAVVVPTACAATADVVPSAKTSTAIAAVRTLKTMYRIIDLIYPKKEIPELNIRVIAH
jgi:hypothetical protein